MVTRTTPVSELKTQIREAGLRSTGPRLAVLRHLQEASRPVSHGELSDALAGEGLDRTTLYRNLIDLTEAGLVQRTDLGDHVWRFELKKAGHDSFQHPHFTCTDCGTVKCLPESVLAVKPSRGTPRALAKHQVEIQLRGQCDDCG